MAKHPTPPIGAELAVPFQLIERRIYLLRGHKVILDSDLAELYEVTTGNLNLAVRRNPLRFPMDFVFQLTEEEFENLRLQTASSSSAYGGRRYLPNAFTEQGVAMLSSVLRSERAILVNIAIIRAFLHIREYLSTHKDLAQQLEQLNRTQDDHAGHINAIWQAIDELITPPPGPKKRIGYPESN